MISPVVERLLRFESHKIKSPAISMIAGLSKIVGGLDDLKLLAIHRDLRATPRVWPDDAIPQTAIVQFSYS